MRFLFINGAPAICEGTSIIRQSGNTLWGLSRKAHKDGLFVPSIYQHDAAPVDVGLGVD
jgi:hypothetical protein